MSAIPATATLDPSTHATQAVVGTPRVRGIDLARGLAMFGMFAAHVGPDPAVGGITGAVMFAAEGHSSILFATLAGISLALMTGGSSPKGARDGSRTRSRIAVRGLLILGIGVTLTALGTPVAVILAYYGVFFIVAVPFLRVRARTLLMVAGGWAVAGPIVATLVQSWWWQSPIATAFARVDPISLISGEGLDQLLVTGVYPAITWMPFILVGLAVGRMDVARLSRATLGWIGVGLAATAYGAAGLSSMLVPSAELQPFSGSSSSGFDGVDAFGWTRLLGAEPHSGSPFEIVGGIGVALVVVALCLGVANRFPRATAPVAAVGSMSLTIYCLHVVAINVSGLSAMPGPELWVLVTFIAGAITVAVIWTRFFRRGPLEALVHSTTLALVTPSPTPNRRIHS
ncbi:DUF418 domain-containing protein [Agreia sp. COWG]|uniref:DUF418 domain-containing protein n=1 Tax=Agreia sp. COWG TaxID=2773266 RepID=UPI0019282182|nr:acyltransferase family protein [Agreia sp. COWG]CAD5990227.1 conserved membrane protein of unknown function [Agreia sp. COWG]